MADLVNPYANPYLPSFVNQRPVINQQPTTSLPTPQMNYSGIQFGQIHSAKGFEGADVYANTLANGASEILAEEDPNLARIYIVAKDQNGQVLVQAHDLSAPIERPKVVTMDDLNTKMNQLLDRMSKLEEEKANGNQPISNASWKNSGKSGNAGAQSAGRNGQNASESHGGNQPGTAK